MMMEREGKRKERGEEEWKQRGEGKRDVKGNGNANACEGEKSVWAYDVHNRIVLS